MKKMFSLALALIMALALCVPTFAADVTVEGAVNGETYKAYKVFDYTANGNNYAYTIASNSQWKADVDAYAVDSKDVFTLTPSATDATKLVVTINDGASFANEADAKAFADYLMSKSADKTADKTVVAANDAAVFTGLDAGYYFMDTSLGALCALMNAGSSQTLLEKNSIPSQVKKIVDGDEKVTSTTASIGDVVNFEIVVTDAKGTDAAIVIHDEMDAGLTLDESSFEINGVALDKVANVSINHDPADDCTFEITFNAAYVLAMEENATVSITYSAMLNENADVVNDDETNTSWLTYSQQTTEETVVTVYTYDFDLVKTVNDEEGATVLSGAKFELYDAETAGNKIALVEDGEGVYRVATDAEVAATDFVSAVIEAGEATIQGLANGTYWLEETQAPNGYNLLTARQSFTIENADLDATIARAGDGKADGTTYEADTWVDGGVRVINNHGSILPSTGGIGTTIFYTVGGLMMAAAVVLFVTKKKLAVQE